MTEVDSLKMSAKQWHFLSDPKGYVKASESRALILASTRRQFKTAQDILARLNGSFGQEPKRGLLLADDVGLGKTSIGALVAWVIASAGEKRSVRILAPNDTIARRWEKELKAHVEPLNSRAKHFGADEKRVKGNVGKLSAGSIQVVNHFYAVSNEANTKLKCDLLIIDEAHRAKGKNTQFSKALVKNGQLAKRILILTATPFSIQLDELNSMLRLIGADEAIRAVAGYSKALDGLYSENTGQLAEDVATKLVQKATAAVGALSSFVIRHSVDDLKHESKAFGSQDRWSINVEEAKSDELEMILRMDRAFRLANSSPNSKLSELSTITNDPRFHVGWQHLYEQHAVLKERAAGITKASTKAVLDSHIEAIQRLRETSRAHPKMQAVAGAVQSVIDQGDKVVLFCDHHATAQELTSFLASMLVAKAAPLSLECSVWKEAWEKILVETDYDGRNEALRQVFIDWLCSDYIRAQTSSWFRKEPNNLSSLSSALRKSRARVRFGAVRSRNDLKRGTLAEEAKALYRSLFDSRSSRSVLQLASKSKHSLPGTTRVVGFCEARSFESASDSFVHNQQPDTIISIFNSPFGPDVLVVTDKLSEGVDLHRYCRHLIHYELDPSPIRTVQRNGRIRRIDSWSAYTGEPVRYAYPAFPGTRDEQLVWIMSQRLASFSLLLGGVHGFDPDTTKKSDEEWRMAVLDIANAKLSSAGGRLCAR